MSALCRSCQAPIVWQRTEAGKAMPLDPEPRPDGNVVIVGGLARVLKADELVDVAVERYVSHFATCPTAYEHRRVPR